jgi:hypothetical protein
VSRTHEAVFVDDFGECRVEYKFYGFTCPHERRERRRAGHE